MPRPPNDPGEDVEIVASNTLAQSRLPNFVKGELRWFIPDVAAMTMRNVLRYRRSPDLLVFATIQPVIFVLLFTFVFGGAIQTVTDNYIDYLLPGILVQTSLFGATNTGFGLAQDITSGLVDRYRSLPMARSAVIAGRILADTLRNLFVITLMIGVGYALGFRFHTGVGYAIGVVATLAVFSHAFSWISAFIGISLNDAETVQVAGFVWLFPLTFMSSAFVPVATMPDWLQVVAQVNPVTVTVDALRAMSLGFGEIWGNLWQTFAWAIGIIIVFASLAITRYRRLT